MISARRAKQIEKCHAKSAHLSEMLARNAATLQRYLEPGHPLLFWYDCPFCPDWHLTKTPQPVQRGV